jgi:hypothetical protein
LNGIGAPPGWTVAGPCAVMVTSMPPADPCGATWGPGEADEVTDVLDGDVGCPAVVVAEVVGVPEVLVVLEFEQPTRARSVAVPTSVARRLEAITMTPSVGMRGCGAAQPFSVGESDPADTGQRPTISGHSQVVQVVMKRLNV